MHADKATSLDRVSNDLVEAGTPERRSIFHDGARLKGTPSRWCGRASATGRKLAMSDASCGMAADGRVSTDKRWMLRCDPARAARLQATRGRYRECLDALRLSSYETEGWVFAQEVVPPTSPSVPHALAGRCDPYLCRPCWVV